jgi:hypothetical protein
MIGDHFLELLGSNEITQKLMIGPFDNLKLIRILMVEKSPRPTELSPDGARSLGFPGDSQAGRILYSNAQTSSISAPRSRAIAILTIRPCDRACAHVRQLDEPIGLGPVKRDLLNLATRQLPAKISGELLLELAIARAIDNHFCRL